MKDILYLMGTGKKSEPQMEILLFNGLFILNN